MLDRAGHPLVENDGTCRFDEESPARVELCKAVRIVSGLNAALLLAESGLLIEAGSKLRSINDFAAEIIFLYEGAPPRQFTTAHREFVANFFAPVPRTLQEFQNMERRRFQGRDAIQIAHDRLAQETPGMDSKQLRDVANWLAKMENSFVHGGYPETMAMYDAASGRFDTDGVLSKHANAVVLRAVAQKAHFAMIAFWFMALERNLGDLGTRIYKAQADLAACV